MMSTPSRVEGAAGVVRALGAGTLLSGESPGVVGEGTANVSVDGILLEVTNENKEVAPRHQFPAEQVLFLTSR